MGRGANGEKWQEMATNGEDEFAFFICQIRHFSPIFDFGISHLFKLYVRSGHVIGQKLDFH